MPVENKKREGQQLLLRFPDGSDLRERLEESAKASSRSLTGEIVHRLEASLKSIAASGDAPQTSDFAPVPARDFNRLSEKVQWLEDRIKLLEAR